ncbi:MAG: metallophosphoesterase [Thiopseudomonas sp.]|nr:metallophosphoesterase [Thiopseudomonas sp.]
MQIEPHRGYDIIGDVHGCADALERLLHLLGYRRQGGVWQHPQRMAVFLGDIIDRGPHIRHSLDIVRSMVERGHAHSVMGNHEYYALAWHTAAPSSSRQLFVRDHTSRHAGLWQATAEAFADHPQEWQDYLDWFAALPLFIDGGRFRVVHACWDRQLVAGVQQQFGGGQVDRAFVQASADPDSFAHQVFNRLLRGINLPLPGGLSVTGQDGLLRTSFRARFWEEEQAPQTYAELAFQPDPIPADAAATRLPRDLYRQLVQHEARDPLLFVGHYWRDGEPALIRPNLACLDYSAVNGGRLVAYRLGDEARLLPENFVWVEACP